MVQQFVLGMLTNHGELQLEKIHNMLKIFIEGGYSASEEHLKAVLMRLVKQGSLTFDGTAFRKA